MSRREITAGKAVIVVDLIDRATANFGKITSKMMSAANAFKEIGRMSAGGAILSGLVSRNVINHFVEFEDQMLNLTAKLGYFGTLTVQQQANINNLRRTILDLGKSTSYTSKEVADAAVSLAQAGFSVTEIRSSLKSVLDLARGTGYSLGETADMMANVVRTFDMFKPGDGPAALAENMATVEHVASMMVKATRLGTVEIQDLRESLKYAAGSANNLGGSLPVVLGLLVQMSESGLKASLAGTSMNTAFLNLIQNMKALKDEVPGFNVFEDAMGKVDFQKTFKSLMDATKNMSRIKKTQLFQDIFNIRGARMISSVQEMERVEYFIREIAGAGQEAAQSSAMMESGLGGAIRRLTSAFDNLKIAWGYTFRDGATAIANFGTVAVSYLADITHKYKGFIAALIVSPAIFAAIAVAGFSLSFVLSRLTYVVAGLSAAFRGLRSMGGLMASSVMKTGSMLGGMFDGRGIKAAAIKRQAEKVAKLQSKIQASVAKAQAKKTPASREKALAKVYASKGMANMKAAQQELARMTNRKPSMLAKAGNFLSGIGKKASALNTVRKERAEIKSQIKLEGILQKKNLAKTIKDQRAITANNGRVMEHLSKFQMYEARRVKNNKTLLALISKQSMLQKEMNSAKALELTIEKAYDKLYKVRQQLASAPGPINQISGAAAGKRTPLTQEKLRQMEAARQKQILALKQREAKLAGFINRNQQVAAFKRAHAEKQIARVQQVAAKVSGASGTLGRRAQVQRAQVHTATKLSQIELKRARAARGAAGMAQLQQSTKRVGAAQRALSGASYMKTLFSGASMGKTFAAMGKGVSTLFQLFKAFGMVTVSISRFVFSWNAVGLVLNALLLFGDKIQPIRKAFADLMAGFSAGFAELGKIATYAAPAIDLFRLAFEAFVKGETGIGITALTTGLQGLVGIVANQLSAAWNAFASKVASVWLTIKQIGTLIWNVISSMIQGITSLGATALEPIINAFSGKSAGGEGLMSGLFTIAVAFDNFVTEFAITIQTLVRWGYEFQKGLGDKLGNTLRAMGSTGAAAAMLVGDGNATKNIEGVNKRIEELNTERAARQKNLQEVFNTFSQEIVKAREEAVKKLNQGSFNIQGAMQNTFDELSLNLDSSQYMKQIQQQAQQAASTNVPSVPSTALPTEIKQFQLKLEAVVGSIGAASKSRFMVDTPKMIDQQKLTNDKLDELINTVKTNTF